MRKTMILFLLVITSCAGYSQKTDSVIHRVTTVNKNTIVLDDRPYKSDPAYFIDNEVALNMKDINPSKIFSAKVLKGNQDTVKYGPKAKNGVIAITTKAFAKRNNLKK